MELPWKKQKVRLWLELPGTGEWKGRAEGGWHALAVLGKTKRCHQHWSSGDCGRHNHYRDTPPAPPGGGSEVLITENWPLYRVCHWWRSRGGWLGSSRWLGHFAGELSGWRHPSAPGVKSYHLAISHSESPASDLPTLKEPEPAKQGEDPGRKLVRKLTTFDPSSPSALVQASGTSSGPS